ncbi:MFS general substrate transporter [Epithele typhae]|uniref:MFS general substrate transporter n=1 Tax=Epithele typhae TaxID=378194 RepID=UPI00200770ED|nr:MFS general substrate transporter [Epithele typhae]KAH9917652.1 MFS general substrate transporter [Epithele typhae]
MKTRSEEKLTEWSHVNAAECAPSLGLASEQRAWRKMDMTVLPLITMMYFLSSLDRSNIGNAKIAGLQHDIGITTNQYSLALTIALIPYVLVEVPANIVMLRIGPRVFLSTLVTLWGVACTLQGVVRDYPDLLACRFFLGFFEGGLPPGVFFYLASFYPRRMLQFRMSIMFSASAFASAFSGLLAAGILKMDGVGGRPGWAWVFILEGLFSVLFGAIVFILLPNSPSSVYTLNREERDIVTLALFGDGILDMNEQTNRGRRSWRELGRSAVQPQVLLLCSAALFSGEMLILFCSYLPSIVAAVGYEGTRAQLMSVPPFAVGAILSISTAIWADRFASRGATVIFFSLLSTAGFAIFLVANPDFVHRALGNHARYGSLFLAVPGTYSIVAPLGTWMANNTAPLVRRATSVALLTACGNAGAILSTWLYGTLSPAPAYTAATITLLVLQVGILICAATAWAYLAWRNRVKARRRAEVRVDELGTMPSAQEMSDESIWFQYVM